MNTCVEASEQTFSSDLQDLFVGLFGFAGTLLFSMWKINLKDLMYAKTINLARVCPLLWLVAKINKRRSPSCTEVVRLVGEIPVADTIKIMGVVFSVP